MLLALVFLFCSLKNASALQKANAQDYRDIEEQASKVTVAENDIMRESGALNAARGNEAEELRIRTEIARLKKVQKNAAEQAMWLTARAYDIIPFVDNVPILDKGISVLRSKEIGASITWLPIFDEIGPKPLQYEDGTDAGTRKAKPDVAGNTATDGMSRIFPGAFSSPEMLASIIIHEQQHFIQNVTDGEGNKKTTAELEVAAYEYEWRIMKVLGFSGESERSQKKRLTEILNGKKGVKGQKDIIGKRKQAEEERAQANKFNGGLPPPELRIVSHSEVEIESLIRQAKDQIEIAQREHDERLRNILLTLTARSCGNPGSVTQADLDGLPKPHRADFLNYGLVPVQYGECSKVYFAMARREVDAESLRRMSMPQVPV
ncbi:MAG: hypothetical protein AAB425_14555, partial [Bdellovibrionota bacterium]